MKNKKKTRKFLEVKGKDEVGATMDSMELERQRGITIQVQSLLHVNQILLRVVSFLVCYHVHHLEGKQC